MILTYCLFILKVYIFLFKFKPIHPPFENGGFLGLRIINENIEQIIPAVNWWAVYQNNKGEVERVAKLIFWAVFRTEIRKDKNGDVCSFSAVGGLELIDGCIEFCEGERSDFVQAETEAEAIKQAKIQSKRITARFTAAYS